MKKLLLFFLVVLLVTNLLPRGKGEEDQPEYPEYQVKSTFIYKICKFTQWPEPQDADSPFIISVLGKLPPGEKIRLPPDITIHKRNVVIRRIRRLSEVKDSAVLFIASSETHRIDTILDTVGSKPILTVGDTKGFGQKGVIINLYIEEKAVGFEINHEASKKASLQMHSQLFTTGKVVKTKTKLSLKNKAKKK
jgi:hypothetical protein